MRIESFSVNLVHYVMLYSFQGPRLPLLHCTLRTWFEAPGRGVHAEAARQGQHHPRDRQVRHHDARGGGPLQEADHEPDCAEQDQDLRISRRLRAGGERAQGEHEAEGAGSVRRRRIQHRRRQPRHRQEDQGQKVPLGHRRREFQIKTNVISTFFIRFVFLFRSRIWTIAISFPCETC